MLWLVTALILGYILFYDLPAAAQIPSNSQQNTTSWQDASLNHPLIQNDVIFKPGEPVLEPPKPTVRRTQLAFNPCSCVSYAKYRTGFSKSIGYARNWPINSSWPIPGGIVVTSEGRVGHVAVIKEIRGTDLILQEANFIRCRQTTGRVLPISSPLIVGYWIP